jgi:hypothetical protein
VIFLGNRVKKYRWVKSIFTFVLVFSFVVPIESVAETFSSSNFKVLDPVINISGDRSTSANFILLQALGELGLGTSSATSFQITPGFLAFPAVTAPAVTATAGDAQATLSWTAASGFLGWTVSSYNVGQSTTAGGPYTYTSLGNVLSSTRTGLSNGTTYYFVIRPEDIFGNTIATSTEVSATPQAGVATGGGGGGPPSLIEAPPFVPRLPVKTEEERREELRACLALTDFNNDGVVNIVDFSIFLYAVSGTSSAPSRYDLDNNGIIDLVDISILFYCWG